jgi:alpha-tubulin suppressor-like RCC1 family protein
LCWGDNDYGELGDGTTTQRNAPVAVGGLPSVIALAAGGYDTCALTSVGGLWCWGADFSGQLGDGTVTENRTTPVAVSGVASVTAIAPGAEHTCAVTVGGAVLCWGENDHGQLGDGLSWSRSTPGPVSGLASGVTAIGAGGVHLRAHQRRRRLVLGRQPERGTGGRHDYAAHIACGCQRPGERGERDCGG